MPAKIQVFEAETQAVAMPPFFKIQDRATLPLAPGRYRFLASRGPEYDVAETTVTLDEGQVRPVALELKRIVDTAGFVACDLHQHTALSADSGVSAAERVASNAVEGVECAVASEHNQVADFGPVVKALGLEAHLRSIPGNELTADASRVPFGHANVFPLVTVAGAPRGGAIDVRDRTARELFDAMRALPGEKVIQVNHPRSGRTGYFDQHGFDPSTGVGTASGYDARFDALEVWSGRHTQERTRVLDDFFALLRTRHPVTPTANTDTHGIVGQEAGYPRTYVRVQDDDPGRLSVASLVEGVRKRRNVVLTNGPFLTARMGEVSQGGLFSFAKGSPGADLAIHVERAPWVDVSEVTIWVGGVSSPPLRVGGRTNTRGALVDDLVVRVARKPGTKGARFTRHPGGRTISIEIGEDTFLVVMASGKKPLVPVLAGDASDILPFAMTSPLWIDADGDGAALSR